MSADGKTMNLSEVKTSFFDMLRSYEEMFQDKNADPEDIAVKKLELVRAAKKSIEEKSSPEAFRWYGACWLYGSEGFPLNIDQGIKYLNEAVMLRSMEALTLLGDIYSGMVPNVPDERIDLEKAIKNYARASDLNDGYASFRLADIYLGVGPIKRDLRKALDYVEKSATHQGNDFGKCLMARWMYIGEFMQKDFEKAFEMFNEVLSASMKTGEFKPETAAGINALFFVGAMTFAGEGVPADEEAGYAMVQEAAAYNDSDAISWVDNYLASGR